MQTFRDEGTEAIFFQKQQLSKYTHIYSVSLYVPPQATVYTTEATLQIMEDADFHCTHLSGSAFGPTNGNTRTLSQGNTAYSLTFPMAGASGRSDRGLSYKFVEIQTGRPFNRNYNTRNQNDLNAMNPIYDKTFVNFGDVFGPGYGFKFGKTLKYQRFMERGYRMKIQFQNNDVQGGGSGGAGHYVSMAFIGNRYV